MRPYILKLILAIWLWISGPIVAQPYPYHDMLPLYHRQIEKAVLRHGPGYHYRLRPDGVLQTNREDGRGWLRLRYK